MSDMRVDVVDRVDGTVAGENRRSGAVFGGFVNTVNAIPQRGVFRGFPES